MSTSSGTHSIDISRSIVLFITFIITSISSISAYSIGFEQGEIVGSVDTTMTYGQTYRVQSSAAELIGIANGGTAFSANGDDGNLNYNKTGAVSSTIKFTSELEANYRNFGAFVRGTGFKDTQADDISGDTERTPLTKKPSD